MSTVYNLIHGSTTPPQQNQNGILNRLQTFASGLQGNPEQIVRSLLASGQMSQEQFNALSQQASQIQQMMRGF